VRDASSKQPLNWLFVAKAGAKLCFARETNRSGTRPKGEAASEILRRVKLLRSEIHLAVRLVKANLISLFAEQIISLRTKFSNFTDEVNFTYGVIKGIKPQGSPCTLLQGSDASIAV